jgi:trans-aconitate 2-methyltransferase
VPPHDWDATTYDRLATGVKALGHEVLDRLVLRGDETVLDAGCGPGEVTLALVERLPRGRVIAVDASPRMVAEARARLGDRADVRVCDLLELDLGGERVDAVLSTATFHWIRDHDRLFARLRAVMRDGAPLVAQCGGDGNIAQVAQAIAAAAARPPFAEHIAAFDPWLYAGPAQTEARLRAAGFAAARCWLEERPVTPSEPRAYLRSVILGAHLEQLPAELAEPFVDAVAAALPPRLTIGYVRLNIDALA